MTGKHRTRSKSEGKAKMSEPRQGLKSLGLENAVRLRRVLRDIRSNRLKISPPHPNDLCILVDMGFVEIQNDVPVITSAGLREIEITY